MLSFALALATIVVASCVVGQAICALCGSKRWSAAAPAVGVSVLMLVCYLAIHLPGRTTLPFIAVMIAMVGGLILMVRAPDHRPPGVGVAAMVLAGVLAVIPFLSAGRVGTLGVTIDNDMATHLTLAAWIGDGSLIKFATDVSPPYSFFEYYPLGPHAVVATISHGWGISLETSFAAFTVAGPVLAAVSASGIIARLTGAARLAVLAAALASTLGYLTLAYMGQGSFKELTMVVIVLGMVAGLMELTGDADRAGVSGPLTLVPLALMSAGALCVYSITAAVWLVLIIGGVGLVRGAETLGREGTSAVISGLRRWCVPALIASVVLVVVVAPEAARFYHFYRESAGSNTGAGISKNNLGNLLGQVDPLEAAGAWAGDYRLLSPANFGTLELIDVLAIVLAVAGLGSMLYRRRWEVPVATLACALLWAYFRATQSPYVSAKALVIVSPLVLLCGSVALLARPPVWRWWDQLRYGIGVVVLLVMALSSFSALKWTTVGPSAHETALRQLLPAVGDQPTLVLQYDEFVSYWVFGQNVQQLGPIPVDGNLPLNLNPAHPWTPGAPFTWTSAAAATLDAYRYVITPTDPLLGPAPPNFVAVSRRGPYTLYRRTGATPTLTAFGAGGAGGAFSCANAEDRRLSRMPGVAGVSSPPTTAVASTAAQGQTSTIVIPSLAPGAYNLGVSYASPEAIQVEAPGDSTTLPATLDRRGPFWPAGIVDVRTNGPLTIQLKYASQWFPSAVGPPQVVLVRQGQTRVVPLKDACGQYVDWYALAAG